MIKDYRVKAPLGGFIFENSIHLEIYYHMPVEFFKIICTLSQEIQLCNLQNNKGANEPAHRQSDQCLFFLETVYEKKNQKYRLSFKQFGSVGPDLRLNCLLMLSAYKK